MRNLDYHVSEIRHCRHRVAENSLYLKAMRLAPPNTYLPVQIRQAELGYDFWRNRLRLLEHVFHKYHPDQPRVPAGNSDGGQWTDGGAASSESLRPTKIDFSGSRPGTQGTAINPITPLKPGPRLGRGGGAGIAAESLLRVIEKDPFNSSFKGTADEATDRYNWLLQNAPDNIVPVLHFTPHEFRKEHGPKLETTVVPLLREQAEGACPLFGAVQTEANLATQEAIKRANYRSASEFGTQVHKIMKDYIVSKYPKSLIPERSYLKYAEELEGDERYREGGVRYGLKDSLRLDVLEKVGNGVICVYDLKTGKSGLSPARMREIGQSVHKNFGMVNRILIIPIQPWLSY
jgi:hypothetical protein